MVNEQFIQLYTPLIERYARAFRYADTIDQRDLIQEGYLALLEAAREHPYPEVESLFRPYASTCIRIAMVRYVRAYRHIVSAPYRVSVAQMQTIFYDFRTDPCEDETCVF